VITPVLPPYLILIKSPHFPLTFPFPLSLCALPASLFRLARVRS
jgi:hypothetical protein